MSGVLPLLPLNAFMARTRNSLSYRLLSQFHAILAVSIFPSSNDCRFPQSGARIEMYLGKSN